jgi:hypothetical protein
MVVVYSRWALTLHHQVQGGVCSLAGGMLPEPGSARSLTPPGDAEGQPLLLGGDVAAFSCALYRIEALVLGTASERWRQGQLTA